tara:strand:+ start:4090 stop:4407 length:318 start_codon:yes stop_codon:yes gene_type:complete
MLVVTSSTIENKEVDEYLGLVVGSTVRARNVGSDILAQLKNIIGGELQGYSKLLNRAREEALARMINQAQEKGANAILAFRFQTSAIAPGASEVIAFGTAVKLKD